MSGEIMNSYAEKLGSSFEKEKYLMWTGGCGIFVALCFLLYQLIYHWDGYGTNPHIDSYFCIIFTGMIIMSYAFLAKNIMDGSSSGTTTGFVVVLLVSIITFALLSNFI